ncbi:hypothetical protein UQW22_04925 [Isoptericola halotolerans]|uniref:hypothetical protein n=1 Tax=Isoptericola halotolerans TaxID=300560 RepID=UPI00388DFF6C
MVDGDRSRLVARSQELRRVHGRLRKALHVTRAALAEGAPGEAATRDLLLYCHGFCALDLDADQGEVLGPLWPCRPGGRRPPWCSEAGPALGWERPDDQEVQP